MQQVTEMTETSNADQFLAETFKQESDLPRGSSHFNSSVSSVDGERNEGKQKFKSRHFPEAYWGCFDDQE